MKGGKCAYDYDFPKPFFRDTQQGKDSYPKYRRRNPEYGGFTWETQIRQGKGYMSVTIDNRWVVPYNPFLLKQLCSWLANEVAR